MILLAQNGTLAIDGVAQAVNHLVHLPVERAFPIAALAAANVLARTFRVNIVRALGAVFWICAIFTKREFQLLI